MSVKTVLKWMFKGTNIEKFVTRYKNRSTETPQKLPDTVYLYQTDGRAAVRRDAYSRYSKGPPYL